MNLVWLFFSCVGTGMRPDLIPAGKGVVNAAKFSPNC